MNTLIDRIKNHEGFSGSCYKDTLGYDTIGYGIKLPLTHEEAELLLVHRLNEKKQELFRYLPWLKQEPSEVQDVLLEMSYQLGIGGLMKFKNTLRFIKEHKYKEASIEMLDSLWAKQTPNRAKELSDIMKGISNGIK